MKIAVATADGVSLSQHFGQSTGFVVFEVEGDAIRSRELRQIRQTPHEGGICPHGEHSGPQAQPEGGQGAHNQGGLAGVLGDCEVVLCGGMGRGAAQALVQLGFRPVVLAFAGSAEEAVSQYANGTAAAATPGFCQCQH